MPTALGFFLWLKHIDSFPCSEPSYFLPLCLDSPYRSPHSWPLLISQVSAPGHLIVVASQNPSWCLCLILSSRCTDAAHLGPLLTGLEHSEAGRRAKAQDAHEVISHCNGLSEGQWKGLEEPVWFSCHISVYSFQGVGGGGSKGCFSWGVFLFLPSPP